MDSLFIFIQFNNLYLEDTKLSLVRHLVGSLVVFLLNIRRRIAPCWPGAEENDAQEALEECNICMLYYPALNRSRCCTQGICTECFLQVLQPGTYACPFCKKINYVVDYKGPKVPCSLNCIRRRFPAND